MDTVRKISLSFIVLTKPVEGTTCMSIRSTKVEHIKVVLLFILQELLGKIIDSMNEIFRMDTYSFQLKSEIFWKDLIM